MLDTLGLQGAPTLAVEVIPPNDRAVDIHQRVQDYLDVGCWQVWVLWPQTRSIFVYRSDTDTRVHGSGKGFVA